MTENAFFSRLKDRGVLRISGADARGFLQGLITNDINLIDKTPCVYSCLLTPQGKFLYDFFIYKDSGTLVLDCEGGDRIKALAKLLSLYRLRADVKIDVMETAQVYAIFNADIGIPDPRHKDMGNRSFEQPEGLKEMAFEEWDTRRIKLCIPDGSRDLIPQNSTMDEARMDTLNAVSYDKGCYMGQELTARMHYRGLGKKHLRTIYCHSERSEESQDPSALPQDDKIILHAFPPFGQPIIINEKNAGEMRSSCGDVGIALVKD